MRKKHHLTGLDYIHHILDAIECIFDFTSDIDENAFIQNRLIQTAVIKKFEIIR